MERALDFDGAILEAAPVAENGFLEYVAHIALFDQKARRT
jgi:hypothetical protein